MKKLVFRYRLAETVFFRKIGSVVYVRNVATGEDFVFNKEAWPILVALRKAIAERPPILDGQKEFLSELNSLGLVCCENEKIQKATNVACATRRRMLLDSCAETYGDIACRLQEVCRRRHLLWSAGLELTYRCNERCRHCYCDLQKEQTTNGELSGRDWEAVVDQLADMGCMNVLVTGGEPTLHPAFLEICEHIIRQGMLCDVYTNGLDINGVLRDSICNLPLNSISVSLYSGTANFHDMITGVPGSFRRTLATLMHFRSVGFDAYAKVPIFHGHLEDFFSAKSLGEKKVFGLLRLQYLFLGILECREMQ